MTSGPRGGDEDRAANEDGLLSLVLLVIKNGNNESERLCFCSDHKLHRRQRLETREERNRNTDRPFCACDVHSIRPHIYSTCTY